MRLLFSCSSADGGSGGGDARSATGRVLLEREVLDQRRTRRSEVCSSGLSIY